ncbi:MAG: hypothetical protein KDD70_11930 [Bdellovibrionales bacterium]|nr:hypothetical protein [Bdellovibrionales bacterium]
MRSLSLESGIAAIETAMSSLILLLLCAAAVIVLGGQLSQRFDSVQMSGGATYTSQGTIQNTTLGSQGVSGSLTDWDDSAEEEEISPSH